VSRKYKFHNPDGVYFVTFAVQGWVDIFTRNEYKNILIENLAYCMMNKGLELFAWCSRFYRETNHVHLIARAKEGHTLSDILRDYKKYTSKAVLQAISDNQRESRKEWLVKQFETDEGYRFWRADNMPVELWSNAVIAQKLNYIHQNPVEEGLVFRAENYVYSSAIDYAGGKGMLEIFVIS
jgi:REP element-mobilizing transposase RayT